MASSTSTDSAGQPHVIIRVFIQRRHVREANIFRSDRTVRAVTDPVPVLQLGAACTCRRVRNIDALCYTDAWTAMFCAGTILIGFAIAGIPEREIGYEE
jgi:hypothetical protein